MKRKSRFVISPKVEPQKAQKRRTEPKPAPKVRKRNRSRTFSYRGIGFMLVTDGKETKIFTLTPGSEQPVFQCAVPAAVIKPATQAIAKIALAEQELSNLSAGKNSQPGTDGQKSGVYDDEDYEENTTNSDME